IRDATASMSDCVYRIARQLALRPAERRALLLRQLDHGPRPRPVAQADRERRAAARAHVGDAARLPVLLADHVADHRNLLDHALGDARFLEITPVTLRTQQPLGKQRGSASLAPPDADARAHATRSRMAAAAVPP